MLIRARVVLPLSGAMIPNGAVCIRNRRIVSVGAWETLKASGETVLDLGDVILLPGLINSHCHLDYTHMAGSLPPPRKFTDWLKQIVTAKSDWNFEDYKKSWAEGSEMLLRTGTTTVADIEAVPELLPEVWNITPLRVYSFLEMIGITGRRTADEILEEALAIARKLRHKTNRAHLSPHAPYSTLPDLLARTALTAQRRSLLVSTHLAESRLEYQMFARARGEMHVWLRRSGRNMSDCGKGSPALHLERCGILGSYVLAAHVNYVGRNDPQLLAKRGVHVVHCPRSHRYFNHQRFPFRRLQKAGVNICLGTDSLASVLKKRHEKVELNMFQEMATLASSDAGLYPRTILKAATLNGARALGLEGKAGCLAPGAFADCIALPYNGPLRGSYEAVVHFQGHVLASMINGSWAIQPASLKPE
jgi:cytosine/adenosine deaminase-related metal-dependent hydrolase